MAKKKLTEAELKELARQERIEKEKERIKKARAKSRGFIGEFKKFISKGNVMDLAVGVIIGAAFQNIVTALTNSFINPLISLLTGGDGIDVVASFTIKGVVFDYGSFITAVINFLIMAFILFLVIKSTNRFMEIGKKKEEPVPEAPKKSDDVVLLEEIRDLLKKRK